MISKNENDSNEVALTYSMEHESLIAEGREYIGISLGDEHSVDPCMNTVANHLITASLGCVVIILHNHPSLSKFSLFKGKKVYGIICLNSPTKQLIDKVHADKRMRLFEYQISYTEL